MRKVCFGAYYSDCISSHTFVLLKFFFFLPKFFFHGIWHQLSSYCFWNIGVVPVSKHQLISGPHVFRFLIRGWDRSFKKKIFCGYVMYGEREGTLESPSVEERESVTSWLRQPETETDETQRITNAEKQIQNTADAKAIIKKTHVTVCCGLVRSN